MRPPPAVAKWLLTHLAPSTPESVLGDLQEEYEAGRSTGWYWRQIFRAIFAATTRQITAHPMLTIRAVFVGWAFLWIFFEYCFQVLISPAEELFVRGIADIRSWWPNITTTLLKHIIAPLACAGAGWIVARFHKREMVLMFVMTILAWNLMGITHAFWQGGLREGWLIAILVNFAVMPVSILVGGVLTARMEGVE
jgi:hypothetical protein